LGAFSVVVGAADRVGQGGERSEEERPFEVFVAAFGRVFTAAAAAGAAGDGGQAGVGGQVSWAGEGGAVADFEQDLAAVLTPMPGIETSDLANGQAAESSPRDPKALIGS
jgi:hypothetical protein